MKRHISFMVLLGFACSAFALNIEDINIRDPFILTDNARIRLVSRRFDLSTDTNDNVLVVGGPGTGKTRYYVKPNLLQANASFFVTDPKGTLIREMGGALAELGYEIRAFDTIDFSRSMRFNPIAYISDEAGVIRFARGIVTRFSEDAELCVVRHFDDVRVAAGDDKTQERRLEFRVRDVV